MTQGDSSFRRTFGEDATHFASAPGRVNLIGEHTDYNEGFVLPMPIPQRTRVALRPRSDDIVRLRSTEVGNELLSYGLGQEMRSGQFIDYVQGLTVALRERGCLVRGFDALIESCVPVGAGLSSSAALEVSLLRALRSAFELRLDDLEIALLGQRAEVDFVGAPVGIMDQLAISLGRPGSALFIDTRNLKSREVPLPSELALVVIASGVTHAHGSGEYKQRRRECMRAAQLLEVGSLRDLTENDLPRLRVLPPPLDRRVRHVLTENSRVLETVEALSRADRQRLARLFDESHESMRVDFEVSVPAVDYLVEIARQEPGVIAARLTGGGFGGSVVMLAERERAAEAARRIAEVYSQSASFAAQVLLPAEEV